MIPVIVPKKIDKPWGWELWVAVTEKYAGKIIHINPGQKLSRQYHIIKDETVYVISGALLVEIGEGQAVEKVMLPAGKSMRVTPETIHRFMSSDEESVEIFEASTPELDDVVRLEDVYGRQGTSNP
jgi:mannose-6-phosphate isomerase-like protein (cupin superfamily)